MPRKEEPQNAISQLHALQHIPSSNMHNRRAASAYVAAVVFYVAPTRRNVFM